MVGHFPFFIPDLKGRFRLFSFFCAGGQVSGPASLPFYSLVGIGEERFPFPAGRPAAEIGALLGEEKPNRSHSPPFPPLFSIDPAHPYSFFFFFSPNWSGEQA